MNFIVKIARHHNRKSTVQQSTGTLGEQILKEWAVCALESLLKVKVM